MVVTNLKYMNFIKSFRNLCNILTKAEVAKCMQSNLIDNRLWATNSYGLHSVWVMVIWSKCFFKQRFFHVYSIWHRIARYNSTFSSTKDSETNRVLVQFNIMKMQLSFIALKFQWLLTRLTPRFGISCECLILVSCFGPI